MAGVARAVVGRALRLGAGVLEVVVRLDVARLAARLDARLAARALVGGAEKPPATTARNDLVVVVVVAGRAVRVHLVERRVERRAGRAGRRDALHGGRREPRVERVDRPAAARRIRAHDADAVRDNVGIEG